MDSKKMLLLIGGMLVIVGILAYLSGQSLIEQSRNMLLEYRIPPRLRAAGQFRQTLGMVAGGGGALLILVSQVITAKQ